MTELLFIAIVELAAATLCAMAWRYFRATATTLAGKRCDEAARRYRLAAWPRGCRWPVQAAATAPYIPPVNETPVQPQPQFQLPARPIPPNVTPTSLVAPGFSLAS